MSARAGGVLKAVLVLAAASAAGACARGLAVETENPAYAVEVENRMGSAIIVSWEANGRSGGLGTVQSGSAERFVVAGAPGPSVTILARPAAGGASLRQTVSLRAGETIRVVFSP